MNTIVDEFNSLTLRHIRGKTMKEKNPYAVAFGRTLVLNAAFRRRAKKNNAGGV